MSALLRVGPMSDRTLSPSVWFIDDTATPEARQVNGNTDQRQASADGQDRSGKHGSPTLALIFYAIVAVFAFLFSAMSGAA